MIRSNNYNYTQIGVLTKYIIARCYSTPELKKLRKAYTEVLGISPPRLTHLFRKHSYLRNVKIEHVHAIGSLLQKFDIDQSEAFQNPDVFTILPMTIDHRGMLLQECGVQKITPLLLIKFLGIVRKRLSLLKSYNLFPADVDVRQSIYSHLETPPPGTPALEELSSQASLADAYMSVLEHYIKWKIEINQPEVYDRILTIYQRMQHKSLRLLRTTLEILETELNFSKSRIRRHAYLLYSYPLNTRRILDEVPYLGGLPIKKVLLKYPKILMTNADTLINTINILKENNISDESVRKCFYIFTLASGSVSNRIEENKTIPEFNALFENRRILRLVHHQLKAKMRLSYLRQINMRNASLHLLSAADTTFQKYLAEGADRTNGNDVVHYLEGKLTPSTEDIRSLLAKHPFWFHVPLIQVWDTLKFLQEDQYNRSDILKCIHLVLYPKDLVQAHLEKAKKEGMELNSQLSRVQELNLCLYNIERTHHFTGDGIWGTAEIPVAEHEVQITL